MGERRKRRSLWDKEAEAKHFSGSSENNYWHDSGLYHEFSPSGSYRADDIRDKSGQPSLESIEENPIAPTNGSFNKGRENAPEQKEIGGENKYYQKMSPEFKFSHSLGNDRSHSQRYTERGRSRSRSRSRGRSRSRSLSRGREKERVRGRSRSRDDGVARDQRSWRNRADHGHISRHSYSSRGSRSELRGDVSDPFQGEDEQLQNKSRGTGPCKDFIKGKCRWGDTCRFSHHFASNETFGKGTRYSSSDKDNEQKSYKHGKPLCKYFAAGKCDRNNCRFSHEDSRFNSLEGREGKFTDDDSFYNKGNRRDDLSWRDTTRITDNIKPSGWNESIVTVTNNNGDNINWGTPERADNLLDPNNRTSPPARSDTYSGDLGTNASTVEENMADKQAKFILHGSQLQNQDGLNVQGQHGLGVDQQFSVETWQNVSQVPHIQQQAHGLIDNKPVSVSGSYVAEEVNDPSNAAYPITDSAQNLSQSGENVFSRHSSIPNQTDSGPYPDPPNLVANSNLQPQMQDHQNAIQTIESSETRVLHFTPNLATSEHSAQFGNSMVSLTGQQVPPVETKNTQFNPFRVSHDPINPTEGDRGANDHGNQMQVGQSPPSSNAGVGPDNWKDDHSGRSRLEQDVVLANSPANEGKRAIGEESKDMKNNKHSETLDGHGKAEINANKDEKGMRLFKNSLIEFVKDILKPTWKEGRMSREVHKTIVKKVVDKITSTIQVDHIPRTQEKVEQYLSFSKPKIAKLVQAYVGRCLKADS